MSRPLLLLFLFKESEESEICLNSSNTKLGMTNGPSTNPVSQISNILPSIITDVSNIFSEFLLITSLTASLAFFSFIAGFLIINKKSCYLFLIIISAPITAANTFNNINKIGPNCGCILLIGSAMKKS